MIFRFYCIVSEKMLFKFQVKEIFPGVFVNKKFLCDSLKLFDSFYSSEKDYQKGVEYYNFKNDLLKNFDIPLFIHSGNYQIIDDEIHTKIDVYCLNKDYNFIQQKKSEA